MPIVAYKIPIGVCYGEELKFAADREDLQVGVHVFRMDPNSRYYVYGLGACNGSVYEGYFVPLLIAGETRAHWHLNNPGWPYDPKDSRLLKIPKGLGFKEMKTPKLFYTLNEYLDACWYRYNHWTIEKSIGECTDEATLLRIIECLEGFDIFDYHQYLENEKRREKCGGNPLPLGLAIKNHIMNSRTFREVNVDDWRLYRSIADIIKHQDEGVDEMLLAWQKEKEEGSW